ncbi:MAG TPA: PAS domain-containing protein, partial [Methanomicrobiales archaeon]|nr:PAS domain-containing protein [Methanomicrobiales archaeon]
MDPIGLAFPLTDVLTLPQGGSPLNLLHRGLEEFVIYPEPPPGGLSFYDLCFHQIPEEICQEILRTQNIGKIYIAFLVWSEQLFGDVGIFLPPDEVLEDRQTIESFLRQTSIAIARRQTEDRLKRSEQRFREVLDLSPVPASIVDAEGKYIFTNPKFTDLFGYT